MAPGLLAVLLLALGCALGRVSPLDIRREAVCVCVYVCVRMCIRIYRRITAPAGLHVPANVATLLKVDSDVIFCSMSHKHSPHRLCVPCLCQFIIAAIL